MAEIVPSLPSTLLKWCARLLSAPHWCVQCVRTAMASHTTDYACTSLLLARSLPLSTVLGASPVFYSRLLLFKGNTILGWGRKWSGRRAMSLAAHHRRAFRLVEDGFLRSVGRHESAVSLVLDGKGIYYDCTEPSDLEGFAQNTLSQFEIGKRRPDPTFLLNL